MLQTFCLKSIPGSGFFIIFAKICLIWQKMFEDLREHIGKLIALYEGEKQARERLAADLEECRSANEAYRKRIAELERQVDNLKLTQAFTSTEGGNPAAKEKIEKMIRQLDRCIAQLER